MTTQPDSAEPTNYLDEAAVLLRKMQTVNDTELAAAEYPGDRKPLIDRGIRIAEDFAMLEALRLFGVPGPPGQRLTPILDATENDPGPGTLPRGLHL